MDELERLVRERLNHGATGKHVHQRVLTIALENVPLAMVYYDLGKPPRPKAFDLFDRRFLVAYPCGCHCLAQFPAGASSQRAKVSARTRCM